MAECHPSSPSEEKRILVVDDEEIMRLSCKEILQRAGYVVETEESGRDGIACIHEWRPQILLVDIKMPDLDGFQVMEVARKIDPCLVMIVITGYATIGTAVDAMKAGAYDFLPKPFTPEELRLIIERGYERWLLARESRRLRAEKEAIERRFITFVSHQLKTPLNAVGQYLGVMLYTMRDQLPGQAVTWLERCRARVDEMLGLINDWLALSKLERGTLCQLDATTDLLPIVDQVLRDVETAAQAMCVVLERDVPSALPPVRGDRFSLVMLLSNLIGNAIKYNRRNGSVKLRVALGESSLSLEVSDTGIGISEAHLPRLFSEFFRIKTEATENIPGTGLGLAICQKIVAELGGTLSVSSKEGEGTMFRAQLPLAERERPAAVPTRNT